MTAFENKRGGRVVIHAYDLDSAYGASFVHTFRAEQYQGAVRWLARGAVPVLVDGGVYPLALRKDRDGATLLGLFNLSLDPWPHAVFTIADARRVAVVRLLDAGGRWRKPARGEVRITRRGAQQVIECRRAVPFDAPLFIDLTWR
ncbi:MAG: hypothetical protein H0W72_16165 [Planctomycetes bacterium]|nr:hypothetical protein [Planctomycetota bacterium]